MDIRADFITIYTDGAWDLLHQGHYNFLKQAKELGDKLIVGIKIIENPIMSIQERYNILKHCKYIAKIIINSPDPPNIDFLNKHHITYVVSAFFYGETEKIEKKYAHLITLGKFKRLKRTPNISSSDLIKRIQTL